MSLTIGLSAARKTHLQQFSSGIRMAQGKRPPENNAPVINTSRLFVMQLVPRYERPSCERQLSATGVHSRLVRGLYFYDVPYLIMIKREEGRDRKKEKRERRRRKR